VDLHGVDERAAADGHRLDRDDVGVGVQRTKLDGPGLRIAGSGNDEGALHRCPIAGQRAAEHIVETPEERQPHRRDAVGFRSVHLLQQSGRSDHRDGFERPLAAPDEPPVPPEQKPTRRTERGGEACEVTLLDEAPLQALLGRKGHTGRLLRIGR
jgi:hypothetical protein